jgi:hypothetical protein
MKSFIIIVAEVPFLRSSPSLKMRSKRLRTSCDSRSKSGERICHTTVAKLSTMRSPIGLYRARMGSSEPQTVILRSVTSDTNSTRPQEIGKLCSCEMTRELKAEFFGKQENATYFSRLGWLRRLRTLYFPVLASGRGSHRHSMGRPGAEGKLAGATEH